MKVVPGHVRWDWNWMIFQVPFNLNYNRILQFIPQAFPVH